MTKQPEWKFVANLGDANPIDHGGYFVFVDKTGVYPPEAEHLDSPDSGKGSWIIHRFILEPCTWIKGVLSDNKFHPDKEAWFAKDMGSMCNTCGINLADWIDMICNGNVESRAFAWRTIGEYYGFINLDGYPLIIKSRSEVEARYKDHPYASVN